MEKKKRRIAFLLVMMGISLLGFVAASFCLSEDAGWERKCNALTREYLAALEEAETDKKEYDTSAGAQEDEAVAYQGTIDCVLSIPKIDMERLVITDGPRTYNLSRHFFVAGEQSMHYGDGSYTIFGHQSWQYGRSMNRLDELAPGDEVVIITESGRDRYVVTETVTRWGMDSADFDSDFGRLAIYTCVKQKERPKPYLVVRAELVEHLSAR